MTRETECRVHNSKQLYLKRYNPNYTNAPYCDANTLEEAVFADKQIRKKKRAIDREEREKKKKAARARAKITLPSLKFTEDSE